MNKNLTIGISLTLLVLFFIWFGFDKQETTIDSYSTEFETCVLAKYSETEICIDFDGNMYTETDCWNERVSQHWSVSTELGQITKYNCPQHAITGFKCVTPKITVSHDTGYNFDNYQTIRNTMFYIVYGNGDYSTVNYKKYNEAIANLNKKVIVKTWYGNSYNFDK